MLQEGLAIKTGVEVGTDLSVEELRHSYDAICITIGARKPRDLAIAGRELEGIYLAMQYLGLQNRAVRGNSIPPDDRITAHHKHVVVIGGGDTGSDCVGTANRQGAHSITQIELLPASPHIRAAHEPWPLWPKLYKTSSSQEEGCERLFSVLTKRFIGENGHVRKLDAVQVEWKSSSNGHQPMIEIPGTEFELQADLVLLALGFEHVVHNGLVTDLKLKLNQRGNIAVNEHFMTSVEGIFSAGDAVRGASLVVWAIQEGRQTAHSIHDYLAER